MINVALKDGDSFETIRNRKYIMGNDVSNDPDWEKAIRQVSKEQGLDEDDEMSDVEFYKHMIKSGLKDGESIKAYENLQMVMGKDVTNDPDWEKAIKEVKEELGLTPPVRKRKYVKDNNKEESGHKRVIVAIILAVVILFCWHQCSNSDSISNSDIENQQTLEETTLQNQQGVDAVMDQTQQDADEAIKEAQQEADEAMKKAQEDVDKAMKEAQQNIN